MENGYIYSEATDAIIRDRSSLFEQYLSFLFMAMSRLCFKNLAKYHKYIYETLRLLLHLSKKQLDFSISRNKISLQPCYFLNKLISTFSIQNVIPKRFDTARAFTQSVLGLIINQDYNIYSYAESAYYAYTYLVWGEKKSLDHSIENIKNLASSLLLVLLSQATPSNSTRENFSNFKDGNINSSTFSSANTPNFDYNISNPFFISISSFTDADRDLDSYGISFSALYKFLINDLSSEKNAFLLNILLSANTHFREYCLARTDPELLVLSLLKETSTVFNTVPSNKHVSENIKTRSFEHPANYIISESSQKSALLRYDLVDDFDPMKPPKKYSLPTHSSPKQINTPPPSSHITTSPVSYVPSFDKASPRRNSLIYEMIVKHFKKLFSSIFCEPVEVLINQLNTPPLKSPRIEPFKQSDANNISHNSIDTTKLNDDTQHILNHRIEAQSNRSDTKLVYDIINNSQNGDEFILFSDIHYLFSLILLESANQSMKALKVKKQTLPYLVYELVRVRDIISSLSELEINSLVNDSSQDDTVLVSNDKKNEISVELQATKILYCLLDLTDYVIDHINQQSSKKLNHKNSGNKPDKANIEKCAITKDSNINDARNGSKKSQLLYSHPKLDKFILTNLADPKKIFPFINSAMQTYKPNFTLFYSESDSSLDTNNLKSPSSNYANSINANEIHGQPSIYSDNTIVVIGKISTKFNSELNTSMFLIGWAWFISCKYVIYDQYGSKLDESPLLAEFIDSFS
ncbi:hypothetical protein AYI69_g8959 [Smittium culicis]|uniref:Dymeclin n=1 Tax=Smittium culicis TaxID=133412 RepID=A0A1R1XFY7_9FUNG|nr:hypothetical protein AYI69_g11220 [Smittium culicis]OMJ13557.1 hypothetical protein AYI69_g8959 [Smittium culicis]